MTATVPLHRLAKTIRSKNAGANHYTLDIIFDDFETYERVRETDVITRDLIRDLYGIDDARIAAFVHYPPGNAIKITLRRPIVSGDVGDSDVYGCQQYIPLLTIPIPWDDV
ncbi:MAG: DUF4387 domain-containing protein [Chloroflexi bacterium]|nr:DUF4387 domain-containing protein [Chloroflexota bacterium]